MQFIRKNIGQMVLLILIMLLLFIPGAKVLLMTGLMKTGFFQASVKPGLKSNVDLTRFYLKNVDGKVIAVSDLKGKVILVNFWATWCPPCRAEMPPLNRLYHQYKDNNHVAFLFIDADQDLNKAGEFLRKEGYHLPLFEMASPVAENLFNGTFPTTLIIDRKGKLVFKHEGLANYNSQKFLDFFHQLVSSP